jgi:dipeptidyl aminopeptidase/acylaminoacyl peptidase
MRLVGVALALLLFVPALAQAQPVSAVASTKRPALDFAKLPFMEGPELSPDGSHVAAKMAIGGKQALVILNLFDDGKTRTAVVGAGDNDLVSWQWVNDAWLVARLGNVSKFQNEDFYITRIIGVSADAATINPIAFKEGGQSADVIWTAQDGSPRVLMVRQKSVFLDADFWPVVEEVDVSTGRLRSVVRGQTDVMRWYADASGTVRMGIGYNDYNRTSRLLYRSDGKESFRTLDRADGRRDEQLTIPFLMTGNKNKSMTMSAPDGYDALHEFDVGSLTVGKRVFGVDGYDIDSVVMTPDGSAVAGVGYTSDRPRMHWFDPALAETQGLLDKAVGDRVASIVSMSRDQKRLLVQVGDASQPGGIYYYDAAAGGSMRLVSHLNTAIKSARLGPVTTFRYKAADGLSIEAILTLPKGRDAKNLPLILMPHGGPEARDTASYDWWAQFLADRGYAVVQPNYRGSTGYGGKFLDAGDGEWGLKMQDDLNDAVADLAAKGVIDPKRVCIVGASYGGYAALRAAQRDGDKFRCAISYAGVSDLNGMIRYDSKFLNANASRDGWRQSAPDLKAISPVNHAADFATPILIMHGKKDLRVPVSQSRRMVDRLKAAGKAVEYIEQPEADHHFTREADRVQFLQEIEAFLEKHNPAWEAAQSSKSPE